MRAVNTDDGRRTTDDGRGDTATRRRGDAGMVGRPSSVVGRRLLMCAPDAYDLKYEINAWMSLKNRPDVSLAVKQWAELYRVLTEDIGVAVDLVPQASNAPDMVFTANAGLVRGDRVLLANFRHPERQVEVAPFRAWFEAHGFECVTPPDEFK